MRTRILDKKKIMKLMLDLTKDLDVDPVPNLRRVALRNKIPYTTAWRIAEGLRTREWGLIHAVPSFKSLNLKLLHVIFKPVDNWLEKAKKFNYKRFIAEGFGKGGKRGMIAFYCTEDLLEEHLEAVNKNLGDILSYGTYTYIVPNKPRIELIDNPITYDVLEGLDIVYEPKEPLITKYDKLDLMILTELQKQGLLRVVELADLVKSSRKVVEYRLRRRVKHLIEGYSLKFIYDRKVPLTMYLMKGPNAKKLTRFSALPVPVTVYMSDDSTIVIAALSEREKVEILKFMSNLGEWEEYLLTPETWSEYPLPIDMFDEKTNDWIKKVL